MSTMEHTNLDSGSNKDGSKDNPIVIDVPDDEEPMQIDTPISEIYDDIAELIKLDDEDRNLSDSPSVPDVEDNGDSSQKAGGSVNRVDQEARLKKMVENEVAEQATFNTFKTFSQSEKLFPDVRVSEFHSVLFDLSEKNNSSEAVSPHVSSQNKSGAERVPLPSDPDQKVTVRRSSDDGESPECERVPIWNIIRKSLHGRTFQTTKDIENAIKAYSKRVPTLNVLQHAIDKLMTEEERSKFFSKVLPEIVKYCLRLPELIQCPVPLLQRFRNYSISMHQVQIVSLMANAFFSTFRDRTDDSDCPTINFSQLFSCDPEHPKFQSQAQKTRCILHYFERVTEEARTGVLTFTRKYIKATKTPAWDASDKKLKNLAVLCEGTIEDTGKGMLQVDFANRFVGGGVLGGGAVQEEILFVIYPELLISKLFTEVLASTEAFVITGCERFSAYSGYASGFRYAGDYYDTTAFDPKRRRLTQIIAIDALYLRKPSTQYHPKNLTRELNKAYAGFYAPVPSPSAAIASGKWGCGAFNGDPQLKSIIQLLAASQADKDLVCFTFGDLELQEALIKILAVIKDMTISQVWNLLKQYYQIYCTSGRPSCTLAEFSQEYYNSTLPLSEGDDWLNSDEPGSFNSSPSRAPNSLNHALTIPRSSKDIKDSPKHYAHRSSSVPSSAATTLILDGAEKSKKFNSWLSNLDSFKNSMGKNSAKKTKIDEMFSDDVELEPREGNLTDDQIVNLLDEDDDDNEDVKIVEQTGPGLKLNATSPVSTPEVSSPGSQGKRRNRDEQPGQSPSASSKKIASARQPTLRDFYKK